MTRGAETIGRAVKKPSRKAATPHRAPKTARRSTSTTFSIDELREQLEVRTCERDEALAQQAATGEVLQVISNSAGKLEPVFQAILENATRLWNSLINRYSLTRNWGYGRWACKCRSQTQGGLACDSQSALYACFPGADCSEIASKLPAPQDQGARRRNLCVAC